MGEKIHLSLPRQRGEAPTLQSHDLLEVSTAKTTACPRQWGLCPVLPCSSCCVPEGLQCPRSSAQCQGKALGPEI